MYSSSDSPMAALSSPTSSLQTPEEEFSCPICWDIFQTPVVLNECRHIFCRKCFLTAIRSTGFHCPGCRTPIKRKERTLPTRSTETEEAMRKHVTKCKSCGKLKKYYRIRKHYKTCSEHFHKELGNEMDKVESKKKRTGKSSKSQVNELPSQEQPSQLDNVNVTPQGT